MSVTRKSAVLSTDWSATAKVAGVLAIPLSVVAAMSDISDRPMAPAPVAQIDAVRALVEELGETKTAKQLGVSRFTLGRLLGGLELSRGIRALLRERLGKAA